ncbi:MAG TPA: VOC family protein [Bacteroidota bacterium]|nr:VOC family protein [Bacteroidota bacterium]
MHFSHCTPFLPVADLNETLRYYKDRLGFYDEWIWKGGFDGGIRRDNLHLLFNADPDYVNRCDLLGKGFEIVWFVKDLDDIYNEYALKDIQIIDHPGNKSWKRREFTIRDINGYSIRISEALG